MRYSTIVGIDTHSKKNAVCAIVPETGEMREAVLSEDPEQLLAWIVEQDFPKPVGCVYESGPTGFGLARSLVAGGVACTVAATSKLSYRVDRQKNDRADARWLAQQMLAGGVRAVRVPTPEEESLCHLSRLRGEVASDLRRAKQRVSSFLLLTNTEYNLTKKKWSKTFYRWAESHEFDQPADTFAFRCKVSAVLRLEERLAEVEAEIMRVVAASPKLSAFSLVCEVHDFDRFKNGASFASYLGLVPSESSSGKKVSRGAIAKQGNSHLRRVLVEAASCYSKQFKAVKSEDAAVPEAVRAKADRCAVRLRKRRAALKERNVSANKAKVAVARELAEWIYYIAVMPA